MLEPLFLHPSHEEQRLEELKVESRESVETSPSAIGYTANLIPDVVYRKEESNRGGQDPTQG